MPNSYFKFKQFTVWQDQCAMKVSTLACILGASVRYPSGEPAHILDIGAGTGLLSLMMAQQYENATIDAIEIEGHAAAQAAQNFRQSPWPDRISLFHGDVIGHDFAKRYDLIISNPPFFESNLRSPDAKVNLARHDSGLKVEPLAEKVKGLLRDGGVFYVLLPAFEMERIIAACEAHGLFLTRRLNILNFKGKAPKAVVACFSPTPHPLEEETLAIREDARTYSEKFTDLLKAFYLHL